MKKLSLLFLLVHISALCQSKKFNGYNIDIAKIDSLIQINNSDLISEGIAEGKAEATNKRGKKIASGGFEYNYYIYHPLLDSINHLALPERQKANVVKGEQLIKGKYNYVLHYKKRRGGYSEQTILELYYKNSNLFLAKVIKRTYKNEINFKKETYEFQIINGIFPENCSAEIKQLIEDTNKTILEYYNNKRY